MKNQPRTINNHKNRPVTMKKQHGTMDNHKYQPGTIKTDLELI